MHSIFLFKLCRSVKAEECKYVHITRINFVSSESKKKFISACEQWKRMYFNNFN